MVFKQTTAATCILVLLISLVGFVSYWPLFHQLRVVAPQSLFVTHAETKWRGAGAPKLDRRKQVTWLHMHKFGGTFMTKMAGLQGEVFPPGSVNANWMPDFCSTPQGQRILCAERTSLGSPSSEISWSAMERELDEGDFCEDAIMGTMLREPLGALQSVLSHDRFDKVAILETLRACSEKAPAKHFMYQPPSTVIPAMPPCLPAWDTYQHFDNFATRTLAGAYSQAPCTITAFHLEAAKSQLQRMDVLVIMEELTEHLAQLQDIFRWNITLVQPWKKVNKKPEKRSDGAFSLEEMEFLKGLNAMDLELYEFAMSLALNMTGQAQDSISKRGDVVVTPTREPRALTKMEALSQRVATRLQLRGRPLGMTH